MLVIDLVKYPTRLATKNICLNLHLDIEPASKTRQKFPGYKEYLSQRFMEIVGRLPDTESLFGVRMLFSIKNRKRIDVDNLIKAVLDSATGIIWRDDNQVREIVAKLITDNGDSASILVYRLIDDSGIMTCPQCGKKFRRPPSTRGRGYCSIQCYSDANRRTLKCKECGKDYTLPTSIAAHVRFCSHSCASKYWHKHSPKAPTPQTKCADCGRKVSRREYVRCLACAIEYRRANAVYQYKTFQDFVK